LDIYDEEGDTINCSLYISKDNEATWEYKGSQLIQGSPGTPTQTVCNITIHYNTTSTQGPNLTVSNVTLTLIEGDNYVFNRSSGVNQTRRMGINVYDDENYTYPNSINVSFWLTNESSVYRLETENQTDSEGNSSYYFNPNCSHLVGHQYWIAGTTDSCYQVENATQTNYTYNLTGDLILSII